MLTALSLFIMFADLILLWTWNRTYFRFGIPVFRTRVDFRHMDEGLVQHLSTKFRVALMPALAFNALSKNEVAFRESYQRRVFVGPLLNYPPLMHGLIRSVPESNSTYVTGCLNWWVFGLILLFVSKLRDSTDSAIVQFLVFFSACLLLCYTIQALRFLKVSEALAPHRRPHSF